MASLSARAFATVRFLLMTYSDHTKSKFCNDVAISSAVIKSLFLTSNISSVTNEAIMGNTMIELCRAATCKQVFLLLLLWNMLQLNSISILIISSRLYFTALNSGVFPELSTFSIRFSKEPNSQSMTENSRWPYATLWCKAVLPLLSIIERLPFTFRYKLRKLMFPVIAAWRMYVSALGLTS